MSTCACVCLSACAWVCLCVLVRTCLYVHCTHNDHAHCMCECVHCVSGKQISYLSSLLLPRQDVAGLRHLLVNLCSALTIGGHCHGTSPKRAQNLCPQITQSPLTSALSSAGWATVASQTFATLHLLSPEWPQEAGRAGPEPQCPGRHRSDLLLCVGLQHLLCSLQSLW